MDNITHTLFGATLARTAIGRAGRGTTAALLLSSNAPDIDIVFTAGGAVKYLEWHRGPTHGPLGVIALGCITAGLVYAGRHLLDRYKDRTRPAGVAAGRARTQSNASYAMLALVSIAGVLLHIALDLPTSYGTRLLSPFDWHWFAIDLMPIVDIYLLAALAAGLLFGRGSETARRRNALIALGFMVVNYGLRAVTHDRAIRVSPQLLGATLPPPCDRHVPRAPVDRWPRTLPPPRDQQATRCLVEVAAIPTFLSPFEWRVVMQFSNAYEILDVNVLDAGFTAGARESVRPWPGGRRVGNQWTPAVMEASATSVAQVFLGFSRFPVARSVTHGDGTARVEWTDARFFDFDPVASDLARTRSGMFVASVRLAPDGRVLDARLGN